MCISFASSTVPNTRLSDGSCTPEVTVTDPTELWVSAGKILRDPQHYYLIFFLSGLYIKPKITQNPRASPLPAAAVYQGCQFHLTVEMRCPEVVCE